MEKKGILLPNKKSTLIFLILLFFKYGSDFISQNGYELPIANILFKMIIVLFLILILIKKKQLMPLYIQTHLEDFFKKESK